MHSPRNLHTSFMRMRRMVGWQLTDSPLRMIALTPERCTREKSMPRVWYPLRSELTTARCSHSHMYCREGSGHLTIGKKSGQPFISKT